MNLFPQDNDVKLYETGFDGDILGRKSISKQLSDFVERIENPMVLALDDKWGSGKTYFLKRWVGAHVVENEGSALTVYFDAFQNDYLSDPLISIIAAVSERVPAEQADTLARWKTVAAKLSKPLFGIALSYLTFGAKQHLDELGDAVTDAVSDEVENAAQDLWEVEKKRKDAIHDFKELLIKLTRETEASIVIVVDELDRCRPDYALSVLEVIKHFFSVPKVHFILGVNGEAFENSVKARYGGDIDAEGYLKKFINVTFALPRALGHQGELPVIRKYAEKLISDMSLPEQLSNRCVELLVHVARKQNISLRDVGKILSRIALLPNEAHNPRLLPGYLDILCTLIVTSVLDPKLHVKFVVGSASTEEIRAFLDAPSIKTKYEIDGNHNPDYDHNVTLWFMEIVYCCGSEDIAVINDLRSWASHIGQSFGLLSSRDYRSIAPRIQKDWIELFRN
ncbi:MAG: hypothetical protein GYB24_18570 [Rhodobacteraceae bacterium]|nr:hypothetical protein [Paracoccaceae bacterium]